MNIGMIEAFGGERSRTFELSAPVTWQWTIDRAATIFVAITLFLAQQCYSQPAANLQDSTLNNLVHPPGYKTCQLGDLGSVSKSGTGDQAMILIPGLGFGGEVFKSFIDHYKDKYTIYAITPAGFAGTPAPPMPDTSMKYSALPWTNGIVTGVLNLIEKENLKKPMVVAHFVTGTQAALNLALAHPDKIGKVIIMGGSPYRYTPTRKNGTTLDWDHEQILTPQQRAQFVEAFWAPKWFKTVTKKTWDENMWTAVDYCQDTVVGEELFKESADVPLQVMIRYLLEWMAYDPSDRYRDITVPTMILIPDFEGLPLSPDSSIKNPTVNNSKQYLKYFHQQPWMRAKESGNALLDVRTAAKTRLFMWYDNPSAVYPLIDDFIKK